jgi:hypothetical protein
VLCGDPGELVSGNALLPHRRPFGVAQHLIAVGVPFGDVHDVPFPLAPAIAQHRHFHQTVTAGQLGVDGLQAREVTRQAGEVDKAHCRSVQAALVVGIIITEATEVARMRATLAQALAEAVPDLALPQKPVL